MRKDRAQRYVKMDQKLVEADEDEVDHDRILVVEIGIFEHVRWITWDFERAFCLRRTYLLGGN